MDNEPKPRPRFWPLLFLTAFLLGAALWTVWMVHKVIEMRTTKRPEGFFVPLAGQTPPTPTNSTNRPNQTN